MFQRKTQWLISCFSFNSGSASKRSIFFNNNTLKKASMSSGLNFAISSARKLFLLQSSPVQALEVRLRERWFGEWFQNRILLVFPLRFLDRSFKIRKNNLICSSLPNPFLEKCKAKNVVGRWWTFFSASRVFECIEDWFNKAECWVFLDIEKQKKPGAEEVVLEVALEECKQARQI